MTMTAMKTAMTAGIAGLGLIGGSFAKAYHKAGERVLGYNRSRKILEFAMINGDVDAELKNIALEDNNSNSILSGNVTYNAKTGKATFKNASATKHEISLVLPEKLIVDG